MELTDIVFSFVVWGSQTANGTPLIGTAAGVVIERLVTKRIGGCGLKITTSCKSAVEVFPTGIGSDDVDIVGSKLIEIRCHGQHSQIGGAVICHKSWTDNRYRRRRRGAGCGHRCGHSQGCVVGFSIFPPE